MIELLDGAITPILILLAEWSLRWALLMALLAAVLALWPPRRAATRLLMANAVFAAGLALPALPKWGPGLRAAAPAPVDAATSKQAAPAVMIPPAAMPIAVEPPRPAARPSPPAPVATPRDFRPILRLAAGTAWVLGVGVMALRLAAGWRLLARWKRSATPLPSSESQLLAQCLDALGTRRRVALATHPAVRSPVTLGGLRPMVLVPRDWPALDESVRRGVLLHELAHLARRDDWALVGQELVRVWFWFHPGVHWLLGRIDRERELLCDEAALARGVDRRDYARTLLEFARRPRVALPSAFSLPISRRGTVKARIDRILEDDMSRWMTPLPAGRAIALGAAVLGLALGLGSLRVGAEPTAVAGETRAVPRDDAPKPDVPPAAPQRGRLEVRGKVVDAETGAPVEAFTAEAGWFDPAHPATPIWSGQPGGTFVVQPGGRFDAALDWDGAHMNWLRIRADGYVPEPLTARPFSEGGPPAGELVVRLKRGRELRGQVVDHEGRPVAGAEVHLLLRRGSPVVLTNGRADTDYMHEIPGASRALADAAGRFTLKGIDDGADRLAVHAPAMNLWVVPLPAPAEELTVRLPQPGRIEITGLSEGGDPAAEVRVQLQTWGMKGWEGVGVKHERKVPEGGRVVLDGLAPGTYEVVRFKLAIAGGGGRGFRLEGAYAEVKPGATAAVAFTPARGFPVEGQVVGLEDRKIPGAIVSVVSGVKSTHPYIEAAAATATGPDGKFKTAPLAPGTYDIGVEVFLPGSRQPGYRTADIRAGARVVVPEGGPPPPVRIELPAARPDGLEEGNVFELPKAAEEKPPRSIRVTGHVIDDATGAPVPSYAVQSGRPDPNDPSRIVWGWSEGRIESPNPEAILRETATEPYSLFRILANGYEPAPVDVAALVKADPNHAAGDTIDVTVRLKRGRPVVGRVVDHAGKAVANASVFLVGEDRQVTITGGIAVREFVGGEDKTVTKAVADAEGRFVVTGGGGGDDPRQVAVSCPELDLWVVPIPREGSELTVRLPQPGRIVVRYDIEGDDPRAQLLLQLEEPRFPGARSERRPTVPNRGEIAIVGVTPGSYDLTRLKSPDLKEPGFGPPGILCDRRKVAVKAGQTVEVSYVRDRGARIEGTVAGLDGTGAVGSIVLVEPVEPGADPLVRTSRLKTVADVLPCPLGATFRTARLSPGDYHIIAEAYLPEPKGGGFRSGLRLPGLVGAVRVTVPADGPVPPVRIDMKPVSAPK